LERREALRGTAVAQGGRAGGEDRHPLLARPRVHVDHAGVAVAPNGEVELPEPVDDLVVVTLPAQLPRELGRPLVQSLDVGQMREPPDPTPVMLEEWNQYRAEA
jgi:hypothetical protein